MLTDKHKKICILTSVHPPFDVRIFRKEAKSLAKAGFDVTLAAQHNRDETVDGIRIVPLHMPKNRFKRMTTTVCQAYRVARKIDADIYHFHDPELILLGMLLKMLGYKFIYDVHEDVPRQILSKHWINKYFRYPIALGIDVLERLFAQCCDAIVSATPKIAERFPTRKTVTVQNFPLINELATHVYIPHVERPSSFVYVGGISLVRGAVEMIRAFEILSDIPGAKLDLAGTFSPQNLVETLREIPGWSSVNYHGQVSRTQVAKIMCEARAGLVTLHPIANYIDSYPIKMFEYISAGLPVIASDFPLWRRIIDGAGCGLLVDPLNPRAIAEAMRWILDHPKEAEAMGQRGREAVERTYNWDSEAKKLLNLYDRLLHK